MKTLLDNVMVGLWKYLAVPHHVGISLPDLMLGACHCLKCQLSRFSSIDGQI